ncbi:MAG: peptidase M10 [Myxococcaceae bacterium]|nr:peptidase M10 [Myxococcaceae bacterium]
MPRVAAVASVVLLAACGGQEALISSDGNSSAQSSALTWSEFLSRVYQAPEQDLFLVDGDTTVVGWKNLRAFYEAVVAGEHSLVIDSHGGVDTRWADGQKRSLTYCVSDAFGARKAQVVQALADATAAWMTVADVGYQYVPSQDGSCTTRNTAVVFDVRPVNVNGQFVARSFFPNDPRSARSVEIDASAFFSSGNPTLVGVLRHELGHTLGFRHEHTRPEAGACFEDRNWRALTTYDSASVMHYPQCNGTGDWTLNLTSKDIAGVRAVYGAAQVSGPGPVTPPPATGSPSTKGFDGSLAKGQSALLPTFAVKPGSTFSVVLSGTGDADLYVRFGSAPTSTAFSCRPYLDGSSEQCELTVPANVSQAFVAVAGYTAASYHAEVRWTAP